MIEFLLWSCRYIGTVVRNTGVANTNREISMVVMPQLTIQDLWRYMHIIWYCLAPNAWPRQVSVVLDIPSVMPLTNLTSMVCTMANAANGKVPMWPRGSVNMADESCKSKGMEKTLAQNANLAEATDKGCDIAAAVAAATIAAVAAAGAGATAAVAAGAGGEIKAYDVLVGAGRQRCNMSLKTSSTLFMESMVDEFNDSVSFAIASSSLSDELLGIPYPAWSCLKISMLRAQSGLMRRSLVAFSTLIVADEDVIIIIVSSFFDFLFFFPCGSCGEVDAVRVVVGSVDGVTAVVVAGVKDGIPEGEYSGRGRGCDSRKSKREQYHRHEDVVVGARYLDQYVQSYSSEFPERLTANETTKERDNEQLLI
ncbi:hypothetical protein MLD38_036384 [Melastoma candidum]|uniref:Uncharacterized protein n=1 Tax=Melastoma candidum TaxID=119954 RepID=A0ACB9LK79_9MYRT|nr:hypothetical protein MLD38_036384 [Melastoma candidum]